MSQDPHALRAAFLKAVIPHVPFDGWSEASMTAALDEGEWSPTVIRALFPRGGIDLALAYHRAGDALMAEQLAAEDLSALRYSERVSHAIVTRLALVEDRELVRRGSALFALPQYAGEGAKAIWGTADAIWCALGDRSQDLNWYSKRATLSAVYSASVLYWLGDTSADMSETRAFVARRIEDVMRIEKAKAKLRQGPLGRLFTPKEPAAEPSPPCALRRSRDDLPGRNA